MNLFALILTFRMQEIVDVFIMADDAITRDAVLWRLKLRARHFLYSMVCAIVMSVIFVV